MYSNNQKKTSHTRMPEELNLIGMPITGDSDLFRLRKFINANRHEHDPKELIEIGKQIKNTVIATLIISIITIIFLYLVKTQINER